MMRSSDLRSTASTHLVRLLASAVSALDPKTQLEKHWKKNEGNLDSRQTVETAIQVLQTVVSSDFKSSEIEIGISTAAHPQFRKLTEQEIEGFLNDLADKQ